MAQSLDTEFGTAYNAGAYPSLKIQKQNSGLAATGVITLIGEADAGPDQTLETDIALNFYSPDDVASVLAKYKSGQLVDAFRAASAPSSDPDIQGSPAAIYLVKTNPSTKASASLARSGTTSFATLQDRSYGELGNYIYASVSADTAETAPTTGNFTYTADGSNDATLFVRINGGAKQTVAVPATTTATAFKALVNAVDGLLATGSGATIKITNVTGTNRAFTTGLVGQTLTGTATGTSLKLVLGTGQVWAALPQVGDYVQITSTAPAAIRASGANVGWYVVTAAGTGTAAGASFVTGTRLSDGSPSSFASTALVSATTDIKCLRPAINGLGKSLELYDGAGTVNISTLVGAPTWLSTAITPYLVTSASEYIAQLNVNRQSDGVNDEVVSGGDIVLKLGYLGTSASVTITATTLATTVVGGSGASISALTLSKFKTLSDLANYINSLTGYTCTVSTTLFGQMPVSVDNISTLDQGTYTICSDLGSKPGLIKKDAYAFNLAVSAGSSAANLSARPTAGLPEAQATFYLAGGARGGTSQANVQAAIDACEKMRCNFITPCFSRDATDDITDLLTDSTSSYLIDSINAAVKTHVIKMTTFKRRRNRQAFLSKRTSFANAKLAANNLASWQCALLFQDFKVVDSTGTIKQFHPWMGATLAAGMQAAGFYKGLLFKLINCSGVVMSDGSFSDMDDTDLEGAVRNGLLAAQRVETGGFRWASDQTTYGADASFFYNSIQAIYAAFILSLSAAQRMERAFVGKSLADVEASVALSFLKAIMADFRKLKLIVGDDDAPLGFKDAKVVISGNTMRVKVAVKLATTLTFIDIQFDVQSVSSSA